MDTNWCISCSKWTDSNGPYCASCNEVEEAPLITISSWAAQTATSKQVRARSAPDATRRPKLLTSKRTLPTLCMSAVHPTTTHQPAQPQHIPQFTFESPESSIATTPSIHIHVVRSMVGQAKDEEDEYWERIKIDVYSGRQAS